MKIAFVLFFCFFDFFSLYASDKYILSDRTGSTIDKAETEYFALFPMVKNFISADIYKDSDTTYHAKILFTKDSSTTKDTTIMLSPKDIKDLKTYIENYEAFGSEETARSVDIDLKSIYRRLAGFHFNTNIVPYSKIKLMDNRMISGRLLCLDSGCIAVWADTSFYNWKLIREKVSIIHYSYIDFIDNGNSKYYIKGNSIILNELTKKADKNIQFIKSEVKQSQYYPPELNEYFAAGSRDTLIKAKAETYLLNEREEQEKAAAKTVEMKYQFYIGLNYSPLYFPSARNKLSVKSPVYISDNNNFDTYDISLPKLKFSPSLLLSYRLLNRLSAGLGFCYFPEQIYRNSTVQEYLSKISGFTCSIYTEYEIFSHDPYIFEIQDRGEVTISAGITLNNMNITGDFSKPIAGTLVKAQLNSTYNEKVLGAFLRLNGNYYIFRYLSIGASMEYNYCPAVKSAENANYYIDYWNSLKRTAELDASGISASSLSFWLGTRYYFNLF